jgi:hypothetical protein
VGPQLAGVVLGLWLIASPAVLDYSGAARVSALVAGPLAVSLSWIALSEVTRPVRRINIFVGVWLVVAALVFRQPAWSAINSAVVGLLLGALALGRSRIEGSYGGGWSAVIAPGPDEPAS